MFRFVVSSVLVLVVALNLIHVWAVTTDCMHVLCYSPVFRSPHGNYAVNAAGDHYADLVRHSTVRRSLSGDIILDFEGVGNLNPVGTFYSGVGITFSSNALGIVDSDVMGGTGNFGGEPTEDTGIFFLTGASTIMNVPEGFTAGFSFWYSAISISGSISVFESIDGGGSLLARLFLPLTPYNGAPDPTGQFSPFLPIELKFLGTARSVSFAGTENTIVFDNIQLGLMSDDTNPPLGFFD